ncbi:MAG: hypothetical protein BGO49_12385 [Planctomycetales bacterium 71-10]|nr:MAG: hypothetical protein BGO49_12385 [Planctomycetales bacterium 71-10]
MEKRATVLEQLREAALRDRARPADERFRDMVARGAIDEEGRVLLIGPGHDYLPVGADRRAANLAEEPDED